MQPLDINKIDAKIIAGTITRDISPIEDVLSEISGRIQMAINPLSSASAPLVLLALKLHIKVVNDMSPGADKLADVYGKMFNVTSIKIPVAEKNQSPEP